MKNILYSIFIFCIMMLTITSAQLACAEESGICGDALVWSLSDEGELTISGTGDMTANYNLYATDKQPPWYAHRNNIKSVVIDEGVTTIGQYAFSGCAVLERVQLPGSMTSIGPYAFCNTAVVDISIPDSVTSVGNNAFSGCTKLIRAKLSNGITVLSNYVFSGCSSLSEVIIPDSVTTINSYAFQNCEMLEVVTVPNSVTSISAGAFSGCDSLREISLPFVGTKKGATETNGLFGIIFGNSYYQSDEMDYTSQYYSETSGMYYTKVPDSLKKVTIAMGPVLSYGAFSNCKNITEIKLPASLTTIGEYAFYGCTGLNSINIGTKVTSIGKNAFYGCAGFTSFVIPESVTSIGTNAFYGCSNITDIEWNAKNVRGISSTSRLFSTCGGVDGRLEVVFGANVEKIPAHLFCNTDVLQKVTINSAITEVDDETFYGCTKIAEINLPSSVTRIGKRAFYGCTSLKTLSIPQNVTEIDAQAFYNCVSFADVVLPDGLQTIEKEAFYGCASISSIIIPDGIGANRRQTFYNCTSLSVITIHESVTSIEYQAFYGCPFDDVYLNLSNSQWTKIDMGTFNSALLRATLHFKYSDNENSLYCDNYEKNENSVAFTARITSDTGAAKGTVIAASYDKNHRLETVNMYPANSMVNVTLNSSQGTYIKLMWWDIDKVFPYVKPYKINIQN